MKKRLIITIDGPAGAGKSTVSKALAVRLSYLYLDSGALYRAFAYWAKQEGIGPEEDDKLAAMGRRLTIGVKNSNGKMSVFLNGKEIAESLLRTEEMSLLSSAISARPIVRQALLDIQRSVGASGGIIAEGRDMGTVVFPHADFKFFLDAATEERVKRRYQEVLGRDTGGNYAQVESDLTTRDKQDKERTAAPLRPAADAHLIDSTHMSVREVVEAMATLILCPEEKA